MKKLLYEPVSVVIDGPLQDKLSELQNLNLLRSMRYEKVKDRLARDICAILGKRVSLARRQRGDFDEVRKKLGMPPMKVKDADE